MFTSLWIQGPIRAGLAEDADGLVMRIVDTQSDSQLAKHVPVLNRLGLSAWREDDEGLVGVVAVPVRLLQCAAPVGQLGLEGHDRNGISGTLNRRDLRVDRAEHQIGNAAAGDREMPAVHTGGGVLVDDGTEEPPEEVRLAALPAQIAGQIAAGVVAPETQFAAPRHPTTNLSVTTATDRTHRLYVHQQAGVAGARSRPGPRRYIGAGTLHPLRGMGDF